MHVEAAETHANLSRAYRRDGRLDEAEQHIRAALAIDAAALPPDHWRRSNHVNALMMVQLQRRDFPAALVSAEESLRIDRVAYGDDGEHPEVANDLNSVGMMSALVEDFPRAVTPLRESLALSEAKYGPEHFETAVTRANYGVVLARSGQVAAGEAEITHAIDSLEKAAERDPDEEAATWEKLARVRLDRGDIAAAMPAIDRVDALLAGMTPPESYWDGRAAALRAEAALKSGHPEEALPLLETARAAIRASANGDRVLAIEIPLLLANAALALGRRDDAIATAKDALAALAALPHPPHRLTALAEPLAPIATAGR
jgi:serine/threonine-protein kinase